MKLWEYLKARMSVYADRLAIADLGVTYGEILSFAGNSNSGRLTVCDGDTNAELALNILKCIANGNIAVPVTKAYGTERYEYIRNEVRSDENEYPDLAFIMFTSGTTGKPKGVMLTDENVITNLEYISTYFDLKESTRICISRSLVHIAALTGELLYALINGLTVYFYEGAFNPVAISHYLRENKIEVFCSTPTVFSALARFVKSGIDIRIAAISGERLTAKVAKELSEKFPEVEFYNVYGLTEHSPRAAALLPNEFCAKAGSIGKPIGKVDMKIENGELVIKSPCVMKGYYRCGNTKIRDGWLYTGDAAHTDDEGYYYIDGRIDDMIIRAGVNIFPQEIESVLKECEGVDDCLAFGVDDERYGQKIVVKIKGTASLTEIRKFAAEHLAAHLIPNEYRLNEPIEYTVSGKLKRGTYGGS